MNQRIIWIKRQGTRPSKFVRSALELNIILHLVLLRFLYFLSSRTSEMTEFLITLTQAARGIDQSPFLTNDDFEGKMNKIPKAIPLYKFTPDDWKKLRLRLTKIQASMLRCDADASVNNIIANRDDKHSAETRQIDRFRSVSLLLHCFYFTATLCPYYLNFSHVIC